MCQHAHTGFFTRHNSPASFSSLHPNPYASPLQLNGNHPEAIWEKTGWSVKKAPLNWSLLQWCEVSVQWEVLKDCCCSKPFFHGITYPLGFKAEGPNFWTHSIPFHFCSWTRQLLPKLDFSLYWLTKQSKYYQHELTGFCNFWSHRFNRHFSHQAIKAKSLIK